MSPNREIEKQLWGQCLSPGLALGKVWLYESRLPDQTREQMIPKSDVPRQQTRIERALESVRSELDQAVQRAEQAFDRNLADIFRAHQAILQTPSLLKELREAVERESIQAEEAVQRVFWRWEHRFADESQAIFAHVAEDMADLGKQIRHALAGIHSHPLVPPNGN